MASSCRCVLFDVETLCKIKLKTGHGKLSKISMKLTCVQPSDKNVEKSNQCSVKDESKVAPHPPFAAFVPTQARARGAPASSGSLPQRSGTVVASKHPFAESGT
jgi:hypothetical protein